MTGRWWSAQDAEYPTLEAEHMATGGDHFGTVQTSCPMCLEAARVREERDPPIVDPQDRRPAAHV